MYYAIISYRIQDEIYHCEPLGTYSTESEAIKRIINYTSKIIIQAQTGRRYQLLDYALQKNNLNREHTVAQLNYMYNSCISERGLREMLLMHNNKYFEKRDSEFCWSFTIYNTDLNFGVFDPLFEKILDMDII